MQLLVPIVVAACTLLGTNAARAWDGPELWYEPAHGAVPGGGGIFGTGGERDHHITCEHCHVDRPIQPAIASFAFFVAA